LLQNLLQLDVCPNMAPVGHVGFSTQNTPKASHNPQ
jgi:hypothetical protein